MEAFEKNLNEKAASEFVRSVKSRKAVSGYTHTFYRYPARFSPQFAGAAIDTFTDPGDLVLDPFMGGGTALVEAKVRGRHAVGVDINSLAVFLAQVKTTLLSSSQIESVRRWTAGRIAELNCRSAPNVPSKWIKGGYQRNINGRKTWPIRRLMGQAVGQVENLGDAQTENFARCALLKTGQWALDCKQEIPSADEFRERLQENTIEMCEQAEKFAAASHVADASHSELGPFRAKCSCRSAAEVDSDLLPSQSEAPKLILTSPPYPGVHVLYHRWQVFGRRETPAPFWLADRRDGQGASYYTMGGRHKERLPEYFEQTFEAFSSLASVADTNTLFVQMLAFSEPSWQLPKYLNTLERAGLTEVKSERLGNAPDGRLWRDVPNRKWYADQKGNTGSSNEVVLFHRLV